MFTATLCFYDIQLYIFDNVVCSVSEECIGNCYLPYKGDLKGIRSCTKGWRLLLIGCNGSLRMKVIFLLRSFKILILNLWPCLCSAVSCRLTPACALLHFTEFILVCAELGDF